MSLKEQLEKDLKQAMLAGEKTRAETIRGLKSVILNVEIAEGSRDKGLPDERIISVFQKEAKKRSESAELYVRGGNQERADLELAERTLIEGYLPKQLTDTELITYIDKVEADLGSITVKNMGQAIGAVKQLTKGLADGSAIASLIKERIKP